MTSVGIVDLGYGNFASIATALERAGAAVERVASPAEVARADRLLLPGVGAANFAAARIAEVGIADALLAFARPALGICLGMHLLFERSEEGDTTTLGLIPGTVRKLHPAPGLTVPHMGWGRLSVTDERCGASDGDYVYFAHSYAADDGPATAARADHGRAVPAIVRHANWTGAQFHPERSGPVGAHFLQNWLTQ